MRGDAALYTFTAIDFETANYRRTSICQVGLICVENGVVTNKINLLVRPEPNYYIERFTNEVHGIGALDTADAPLFRDIWPSIRPYIEGRHVVAHNGFAFDFQCLEQTLSFYGLPVPEYHGHCTCRLYGRRGLAALCAQYNIPLDHHDALSDARACAELYLMHLDNDERGEVLS